MNTNKCIYDIVGNRLRRIIDVNNITNGAQELTTRYFYDPNTDKLLKEVHEGPVYSMLLNDGPVYAYASPSGGVNYRDRAGGKIGGFKAFIMGLPNEWSLYAFVAVMALLAVAFFVPVPPHLMRRQDEAARKRRIIHLSLYRRCLCVLIAYVMLISPWGFQQLSEGSILYSNLDARHWSEGNRTIEYEYDPNGSLVKKTTKRTEPVEVLETVTYEYNLQNRLELVIREYVEDGNDIDEVTEYTYNPDGIRVKSYYYETVNSGPKQNEQTKIYLIDAFNHTGYA